MTVAPNAAAPESVVRVYSEDESEAASTLAQLEKVVSEFMIKYPSHTLRIPAIRPGENAMIAFVRSMAASMAAKQKDLERLNDEIVEAAEEKERFFASMSHEVRTPMNGIFGMVNLLMEMDLDPVHREYLEAILASSESLLNILDDILDYSKLNSKQMKLRPRPFGLSKLIRDALWVYKPTSDRKGIQLEATICESLPDHFVADDLRLKQVLCNLVSNAIKFTDRGRISVTVQGVEKSGRNQLLFEVKDSGIGICSEAGKTLFSPFRQIETDDERRFEGTGLGLTISKNLIELMGGRIWFESELGEGTTFFFTIEYELHKDVGIEEADFVTRGRLQPEPSVLSRCRDKFHVLLVEDNKLNQKVGALTLEQLGCKVSIAENGQEAVELAAGPLQFDLICMDVNMPIMNGLDAARAIRNLDHENAETHILAMTGMAFDEDRENCIKAGMDDIITKPVELNDLRDRIEGFLKEEESEVALSS